MLTYFDERSFCEAVCAWLVKHRMRLAVQRVTLFGQPAACLIVRGRVKTDGPDLPITFKRFCGEAAAELGMPFTYRAPTEAEAKETAARRTQAGSTGEMKSEDMIFTELFTRHVRRQAEEHSPMRKFKSYDPTKGL